MNENVKYEHYEKYDAAKDKFGNWLRHNVENIILVFICAIYILRGVAEIEESGKTVLEILADGAIAFLCGYLIKGIMGRKGILKGLTSPKFVATTNAYGKKKEEISGFVEELYPFCIKTNAERLKQRQTEFLLKHAMSYDHFINGLYDVDKEKKKIADKCRKIKVFEYNPVMLTNAYDNAKSEEELLTATIQKYERSQLVQNFVLGIVFAVLFGYYGFKPGAFNLANISWAALQVAFFWANGKLKELNAYLFVAETLRGKIKRVIDILDEFINIRSKHPGIFKVGYAPVAPTPEPIEPTIAHLEKDNPLRNDADPPKDKNFIDRMTQLNDKINALSKS